MLRQSSELLKQYSSHNWTLNTFFRNNPGRSIDRILFGRLQSAARTTATHVATGNKCFQVTEVIPYDRSVIPKNVYLVRDEN